MLKSPGGRPPYRSFTKTTRRAAAALAVPLLLFTAACGSDDDKGSSAVAVATVKGDVGDKPKITVAKGAKASDKVVTKTVVAGKGVAVKKGDNVRADYAGQLMKGQSFGSSWDVQPGTDKNAPKRQLVFELNEQLPQMQQNLPVPVKALEALEGQKVGSRVQVEGTAKALIGEVNPQSGIKPSDGMVFVFDIAGATHIDKKAQVKGEQAAPEDGMPVVKAEGQKAAEITIPKGEKAPTELKEQVLIKGKGREVKARDALVAQYTGVKWRDGKKFDSSWDHGGATAFQIGTGSVVKGWDKGLVGKHIGDRVLLAIPADLAYGDAPPPGSGLEKGDSLVFVVDIVGTF
ncbi:FKBP-type peptidyl-prolyl cis-trans isomerase [Streptomyces piniterrae]|uniref:peptidylprolyl isomerase n=1 Tax=Streptomyces piniterrae TaxID=2571125 RepID=A0A4U0MRN1_9ACTN|nr:FKBP-type peptidyl-prolyl cis-trans isomerase [Streptomyces piniterrae]TJZ43567.1 FKBP-type peptidyl-prolyl cis-trans isomerase [Streptomyces piniterrae]